MNNNIRLGLLAVSAAAALSLTACKTTDEAQESAPQAAPAADSSMPSSTTPADSSMPTNASTTAPTTTP